MDSLVLYISEEKLQKAVGNKYKEILDSLKREGILDNYTFGAQLKFDKNKATHIQAILEFYDVREVSLPANFIKKESK